MTISTTETKKQYNGDGSTTTFAITFDYNSSSDVKVELINASTNAVTLQTLNTDYTISSDSVVFTTAPPSSVKVLLTLDIDYSQETDLIAGSTFSADTVESAIDTIAKQLKQLKYVVDYNVPKLPGNILTDTTATDTDIQANYVFSIGSGGSTTELQEVTGLLSLSGLTATAPALEDSVVVFDSSDSSGVISATLQQIYNLFALGSATYGISNLDDVTLTSITSGEILKWNGSAWVNNTLTEAGIVDWTGATENFSTSGTAATGTLTVTGNINVTGTVDGRDLATDGTKLDGIEASADVTDETNVKSALSGATISSATVASTDKVLVQDADDSDNLKTVTALSIANLAAGGGDAWGDPVDASIVPDTDSTYNLGSVTNYFANAYIDAITTTGNITVGGTVDGRDLATDGTKLDGIEASADVTDETNVKSALSGATISSATVASTDKVLVQDADDSDNLKTVTAQSIADLGGSGGGKVLQVVTSTLTTTASTTSTSLTTTGLSASITPASTSNKVLVLISLCTAHSGVNYNPEFGIDRGGTNILLGTAAGSRTQVTSASSHYSTNSMSGVTMHVLDSPSTTSSTTYTAEFRSQDGNAVYLNRSATDTNSATFGRGASSITLIEIDGT